MILPHEIKAFRFDDFLGILRKRRGIIVVFLAGGIILSTLLYLSWPTKYRARCTILLKRTSLKLMDPATAPIDSERWSREEFRTQVRVLESEIIAGRVLRKLDLPFSAKKLFSMVRVTPLLKTNMVNIDVEGREPKEVADIANEWVRAFVELDVGRRVGVAKFGVSLLEKQLSSTLVQLRFAEAELNEFLSMHGSLAAQERTIERLENQRTRLEEEIVDQSAMYKEKHQRMVSLYEQLNKVSGALEDENRKLIGAHDNVAQYRVLRKRAESYKEIYEELITRARKLDTTQGLTVADVRIIDPAHIPSEAVKFPFPVLLFLVFSAAVIGLAACFIMEFFDSSLKSPEEVEFYTKLSFLGFIPTIGKNGEGDAFKGSITACYNTPDSLVSEAFRNLKTALLFAKPDEAELKTIMIASALPGEGKTFVAGNLAVVFAESGENVLLVDADLRHGNASELFGLNNNVGLSELLGKGASLDKAIKETKMPNLSILPSGEDIANPSDYLQDSGRFHPLFEEISKKYDRIVLDVPSLLKFSDYLYWETISDSVALIVKTGKTSIFDINEAKKKLGSRVSTMGALLNGSGTTYDSYYYLEHFNTFLNKPNWRDLLHKQTDRFKSAYNYFERFIIDLRNSTLFRKLLEQIKASKRLLGIKTKKKVIKKTRKKSGKRVSGKKSKRTGKTDERGKK